MVLKSKFLLVILLTVTIFSTQVQAKPMHSGPINSRADEEWGNEEALVSLKWPLKFLRYDLQDLLVGDGKGSFKEISKIDLDPINRTFHLDATVNIPDSMLLSMEDKAGDKLLNEHSISLVLGFPPYVRGQYVELTIEKFVLDDVDYTNGMHIVTNVTAALLRNRSLLNYFMADDKAPTDYSDEDLSKTIKDLFDNEDIVLKDNRVRLRFNFMKLSGLTRYRDLENLQVWYIGPKKLKGTKQGASFLIEGGIGNPSLSYIKGMKEEGKVAADELKKLREAEYKTYAFSADTELRLSKMHSRLLEETGIYNWNDRERMIINEILKTSITKARKALSLKDLYFIDEPQLANIKFFEQAGEFLRVSIADLKLRHAVDWETRNGGRKGSEMPFVSSRISQNAVSQFTNFFRDFKLIDKEPLFKELNVVLAPHLPGIILRGRVNLELNSLFEMGLEGEGIDFNNPDIRLDSKTYGNSVPFEISLYTYMRDKGVLELDIKDATLGSGKNSVLLTPKTDKGYFLEEFTKLATANILKTYLISDPLATKEDEVVVDEAEVKRKLIEKLENFKNNFQLAQTVKTEEEIIAVKKLDLQSPFNSIPEEMTEENLVEFFNNILGIDRRTGRLQINLDPTILSEKILYAQNNVQVWNIEPIFDKLMDKTYIDLAIGHGVRTKDFLSNIYNRPEKKDSLNFVGTSGDFNNEGPTDYSFKINLREFESMVNSILTASIAPQVKEAKAQLASLEEGSVNILEDLTVRSQGDNQLYLSIALNQVEKKKRWFGARIVNNIFGNEDKNYVIENNRSSISARIKLHAVPLKDYKSDLIAKNQDEIFLGNTLLKIELESIGRTAKNPGLFGSVLNAMIGDVNLKNGIVGSNLKKLVLKIAGPMLNPTDERNGNATLAGFALNNYLKVFTTKKDILLQLNPRLAGPVWDLLLVQDQDFKGRKIGIGVDYPSETINFDFKMVFNPSTVDKHELYLIMKEASEISQSVKDGKIKSTADFLKVYDRLFYNSDITKLSLKHRLIKVIDSYNALSVLNEEETHADNYSTTGAELMQIATAAKVLRDALTRVSDLKQPKGISTYANNAHRVLAELDERFIGPYYRLYNKRYKENNLKIINAQITDWTLYILPDALFAQKAFEFLD